MPLRLGLVNDYGQTLEAEERGKVWALLQALDEQGFSLVYLASWHDPFGDPGRYAAEVFQAWKLRDDQALLVFLRPEGRWRVVLHAGPKAQLPPKFAELGKRAEVEANRARPGHAVVRLLSAFLSALEEHVAESRPFSFPWKSVLVGGGSLGGLVFVLWFLCPRCWRPLRRVSSWGGIMWVCPRCRYTRVGWGRRPGGRRGIYP